MANRYADFLQNSGLYESITVDQEGINELISLIRGNCRLEQYCPSCHTRRVFTMLPIQSLHSNENSEKCRFFLADILENRQKCLHMPRPSLSNIQVSNKEEWSWDTGLYSETHVMVFQYRCSMCDIHTLDYAVLNTHTNLIKIGQYPSLADLCIDDLQEYRKDIDDESFRELRRASGLHAQGIGVGAYVYLRRVFERVLIQTSQYAFADGKVNEENFIFKRVDEKIKLLKDYLPSALVDNPSLYGIISKGIHELSEDDCIKFFPVLKACIIMILRQWKKQREDRESEKQISAEIAKIANKIK